MLKFLQVEIKSLIAGIMRVKALIQQTFHAISCQFITKKNHNFLFLKTSPNCIFYSVRYNVMNRCVTLLFILQIKVLIISTNAWF